MIDRFLERRFVFHVDATAGRIDAAHQAAKDFTRADLDEILDPKLRERRIDFSHCTAPVTWRIRASRAWSAVVTRVASTLHITGSSGDGSAAKQVGGKAVLRRLHQRAMEGCADG